MINKIKNGLLFIILIVFVYSLVGLVYIGKENITKLPMRC